MKIPSILACVALVASTAHAAPVQLLDVAGTDLSSGNTTFNRVPSDTGTVDLGGNDSITVPWDLSNTLLNAGQGAYNGPAMWGGMTGVGSSGSVPTSTDSENKADGGDRIRFEAVDVDNGFSVGFLWELTDTSKTYNQLTEMSYTRSSIGYTHAFLIEIGGSVYVSSGVADNATLDATQISTLQWNGFAVSDSDDAVPVVNADIRQTLGGGSTMATLGLDGTTVTRFGIYAERATTSDTSNGRSFIEDVNLAAIPEPSSILLAVAGLLTAVGLRKRVSR